MGEIKSRPPGGDLPRSALSPLVKDVIPPLLVPLPRLAFSSTLSLFFSHAICGRRKLPPLS